MTDAAEVISAITAFQAANVQLIEGIQKENREAHTRLHERLDDLMSKESVSGSDCENRRNLCRGCMQQKIDNARGWPPWIAGVGTIAAALITGLIMNTFKKGG